jgi:outer membrane immunogenic protein
MKRLAFALLAVTGLSVGLSQIAFAADLPVKAPPMVAAPVPFSWTGCYVGGNVGGLLAHKDWTDRTLTPTFGFPQASHDANSWLGGVQAGCNYQVSGWVFGIQGDYDWTDAKGTNADLINTNASDQTRIRSLASVTGRVGYAWDRFLGYVKGGGAWERADYTMFYTATGVAFATASETRGGWTVGVGGEYAFTDWLSGFAEYDYYDFGTRKNTFIFLPNGGLFSYTDIKETNSVFKVGLNLRWGGPNR